MALLHRRAIISFSLLWCIQAGSDVLEFAQNLGNVGCSIVLEMCESQIRIANPARLPGARNRILRQQRVTLDRAIRAGPPVAPELMEKFLNKLTVKLSF